MSSPNTTSTIFHLFPQLPKEIRLKIWALYTPEPCTIVRKFVNPTSKCPAKYWFYRPLPTLLHICQETRHEYLDDGTCGGTRAGHAVYELCFMGGIEEAPVWISWESDTVYCDLSDLLKLSESNKSKLRNISMDSYHRMLMNPNRQAYEIMSSFYNLSTITLLQFHLTPGQILNPLPGIMEWQQIKNLDKRYVNAWSYLMYQQKDIIDIYKIGSERSPRIKIPRVLYRDSPLLEELGEVMDP